MTDSNAGAGAGARDPSDPNDPKGALDPIALFDQATRYLGLPASIITAVVAYLAWRQGGKGPILAAMALLTAVVVGAGSFARRWTTDRLAVWSQPVVAIALVLTQISIGFWAYAYRGLDGGLWINLMTVSFVAGTLLRTRYALIIGAAGSLTFLAIAIASEQADAAHIPTIAVGMPYVFLMAVLAAGHRRAISQAIAEQHGRHVEVLENSNLEMTAVIQSLTEGLLTTDKEGRVQRWNMALERLTGRSEMEAVGMLVEEALPLTRSGNPCSREEHPCVRALEGHVFDGSHSGEEARELSIIGCDGQIIPVTVSAGPLVAEAGPTGVAAVILDVTRERELGELRDALVSMVSHELRTPLTMILGFSEMLTVGGLTEHEQTECSRQIFEAAQSLNALIEDLLSASALESGQLALNLRSVPVAGLVETVRQGLPESDRIRIATEIPPHLMATGDPDRLNQVIVNLISNALKFSDASTTVTVSGADRGHEVVVAVTDRGIGIDPDQIDSLFGKFARADDERVRSVPGTGLGLYVVEQVVALHGGNIDVVSEPGNGTEVSFTLPVP